MECGVEPDILRNRNWQCSFVGCNVWMGDSP